MSHPLQKTLLLDNGQTVIRHVKAPGSGSSLLVVTFAEINMNDPERPGFAQAFLLKNGFDVVTIQKRTDNWYQDLSTVDFHKAVSPVLADYDRCVCYGLSMGAFASLFYGGVIGASILALSPLVSIHPKYPDFGAERLRKQVVIRHVDLRDVPKSSELTWILYDPMMRRDRIYMACEVTPVFPDAIIQKLPFAGHSVAKSLGELGLLQDLVLNFIRAGETPNVASLMRGKKGKSSVYVSMLAAQCARAKRPFLAIDLYNKAISLSDNPEPLKIKRDQVARAFS